jgi:hypothetical protein
MAMSYNEGSCWALTLSFFRAAFLRNLRRLFFIFMILIIGSLNVERVADVKTGDGFALQLNDIVAEVLLDKQTIRCVDYQVPFITTLPLSLYLYPIYAIP